MTNLIGSGIHGIRKLEKFSSEKARQEAKRRWLTDKEYLAIVVNPHRYTSLLTDSLEHIDAHSILTGQQDDVLFFCNENLSDALDLPIRETQDVQFKGRRYMKLTRSFDEAIERREYVMCAAGDLKLVHYGKVMDETADIAAAVRLARQLEADILVYRDASARKKDENEILRRINSAEVDDEENKTSSRPADRQSGL